MLELLLPLFSRSLTYVGSSCWDTVNFNRSCFAHFPDSSCHSCLDVAMLLCHRVICCRSKYVITIPISIRQCRIWNVFFFKLATARISLITACDCAILFSAVVVSLPLSFIYSSNYLNSFTFCISPLPPPIQISSKHDDTGGSCHSLECQPGEMPTTSSSRMPTRPNADRLVFGHNADSKREYVYQV